MRIYGRFNVLAAGLVLLSWVTLLTGYTIASLCFLRIKDTVPKQFVSDTPRPPRINYGARNAVYPIKSVNYQGVKGQPKALVVMGGFNSLSTQSMIFVIHLQQPDGWVKREVEVTFVGLFKENRLVFALSGFDHTPDAIVVELKHEAGQGKMATLDDQKEPFLAGDAQLVQVMP